MLTNPNGPGSPAAQLAGSAPGTRGKEPGQFPSAFGHWPGFPIGTLPCRKWGSSGLGGQLCLLPLTKRLSCRDSRAQGGS